MDDLLSLENRKWRDRARDLAERVVRPVAAEFDLREEPPPGVLDAFAEAGLFRVWIPEAWGGAGGDRLFNLSLVAEEISRACPGVGVLFCVNALASFPLIEGGTDEQKGKWLPRMASGELRTAFCLSEKGAGSDVRSMRCRARREEGGWVIDGEKKWTTGAPLADLYSVIAVTGSSDDNNRFSAFLVDRETPGISFPKTERKMGIRCVPVSETLFRNCRVDDDRLIGGEPGHGLEQAMLAVERCRAVVAAQAVGLAQGALDWALVHVSRRRQFGRTLSEFQGVRNTLAGMGTRIEAARQLTRTAARAADGNGSEAGRLSSMAKLFATDTALAVSEEAVQLFGGYGYMQDYPVEKYLRDAKVSQIYEGTNEIQRLVIARHLLKTAGRLTSELGHYLPEETQYAPEEGPMRRPGS